MSNEPQRPGADQDIDLKHELREMGMQIEAAIRALIQSDQAKRVQNDLAAGVREVTSQVRQVVSSVQADPRVQDANERGKQVIAQAADTKIVGELQDAFGTTLAQLNTQLRKLVERIESDAPARQAPTPTQHVPVESDPSTGETTRLDP